MAINPGSTPELAMKAGVHRTVPDSHATISVAGSSAGTEGALLPYAGLWVWLGARGGAITIRRYTTGGAVPTLVAAVGFTIADGSTEEFFVDPHGKLSLAHISTGSVTLDIHYDSEQVG